MTTQSSNPAGTTVFLTGCGRSGTTILGKVLANHPDIAYANDRFRLWIEPFPFADVWGIAGERPGARISLDERDAAAAGSDARERFVASLDRFRAGKPVLVEKVAVNNFRLGFLAALAPRARFINIIRHGVEVARSIARRAQVGQWYGRDGAKWLALEHEARQRGLGPLLKLCTSDYLRGLLEWRLSVDAADRFRTANPDATWCGLRYEDLLARPAATASGLCEFVGLASSAEMQRFAVERVRRQNPAAADGPALPGTIEIAGEALARLGYQIHAGVAP